MLSTCAVHRRILAPDQDQDKGMHNYFVQLDKVGMLALLHLIEQAANSVLRMSVGPDTPPPPRQTWSKPAKNACQAAQRAELLRPS